VKILDLVGIFIAIFAKEEIYENITNIDTQIVRTGIFGTFGNKGSCIVRFNYFDTSLAFSCGHFASGDNHQSRIHELEDVFNRTLKENKRDMKVKEHDFAFVFGDLNFRIDLNNFDCRSMIKKQQYETLRTFDQFLNEKLTNQNLVDIEEGELFFDPTYKYDIKSNEYDTSKKKRVPSWCDRIFWKKNNNVQIIKYHSSYYQNSDHRPIYALFKVKYTQIQDRQSLNEGFSRSSSRNNIDCIFKY